LEEDMVDGDAGGGGVGETVQNLEWFDGLSYEALSVGVPTAGMVPRGTDHAVARLKGAIFRGGLEAKARGDVQGYSRAWKAITFLDRVLVAHLPAGGRGRKRDTRSEVVVSRVRRAWRGDWGALLAEATAVGQKIQSREAALGKREALKADVRAIEAYVAEGLLSKAIARAKGSLKVLGLGRAVDALRALLPAGQPPSLRGGLGPGFGGGARRTRGGS
jgi:hypothetical protein